MPIVGTLQRATTFDHEDCYTIKKPFKYIIKNFQRRHPELGNEHAEIVMIQDFLVEIFRTHGLYVALRFDKNPLTPLAGFLETCVSGPMRGKMSSSRTVHGEDEGRYCL